MRLARVNDPRADQRLLCARCGAWHPAEQTIADLDGPAFKAYYGLACLFPALSLVRVMYGEWKDEVWRVSRAYPDLLELQRRNGEGLYEDFTSVNITEAIRGLQPQPHCPVDFSHHLGECCLVCGNDERKMGAHLPDNPDLTDADRARFKRKDEIFDANWGSRV